MSQYTVDNGRLESDMTDGFTRQPVPTVRHLLRGETDFATDITEWEQAAVLEMWTNRLAGFHAFRTDAYLRDSAPVSRYTIGGCTFTDLGLRCLAGLVFPLQGIGRMFGLKFSLELLDANTRRADHGYITTCTVVAILAGHIVRQSDLTMTIQRMGRRLVWQRAVEHRLPRRDWRYTITHRDQWGYQFQRSGLREVTSCR